ncbi:hypothetical protein IJH89_02245, partial [Candidatus Saccharibacteria bacterium]|nr:hypothetical protein [Candidatus Saccharibacteria bacterium]
IWHESWNEFGKRKNITLRYEVRPTGVYKTINNTHFEKLEGAELENFRAATKRYLELIKQNLYHV